MLTWYLRRRIGAFERRYEYDMTYARELLATDRGAFFRIGRISALLHYRRDCPAELYYGASLTALVREDCGPCTQLSVAFALEAGVPPTILAAILEDHGAAMGADAFLGVRFARAVLARDVAADELRAEVLAKHGPRAALSLAFALVSARFYPTLKYALGHGKACTRVVVGGAPVVPARPVASAA
ncbi:MAG TPA: hypothetical protein VGM88_15355 [Kofleriaceae bacterium]|jgi:hypothetical protein